jgi:hypothetical protein
MVGGRTVDTSDQRLVHLPDKCCTELPKACNYEWGLWIITNSGSSRPAPIGVTCYYQHLFCRIHYISPWRSGPAIDLFDFGGGHRRTTNSTPRGFTIDIFNFVDDRCWKYQQHPPVGPPSTLSSSSVVGAAIQPTAPHRRSTIDVLNFGGGRCWKYRRHPPGGPPSTSSSSSVVGAAGLPTAPPGARRFFHFGGGCCRKSRQHPQGARHRRRLQL